MSTNRTAFVIDGFNVYHSLVDASKALGLPDESGTKWLNLRALCESYLPVFGSDAPWLAFTISRPSHIIFSLRIPA